jgi:hypothetical protein
MLSRLDAATIAGAGLAVVCAILVGRWNAAIAPLLAGLCALASALLITPAIHGMRAAGATASARFGLLHGLSSSLLILEMILFGVAVWQGMRFSGIENRSQAG